jgi:N-methylhydantoinase B
MSNPTPPARTHLTNTSNLPVEALELEYPLTLLRYELVDGSAGPGQYRGGMGLRRVDRAEADCRVRLIGLAACDRPWGLAGAPERRRRGAGDLKKGEIVEIVTAGAGGYGRPKLRAASAIARDVIEGRISPEVARTVYGVYGR